MVVRLAGRRSDGRQGIVVNVFFVINDVFVRKHVKSALHLRRDYEPFDNRLSGITRRLVQTSEGEGLFIVALVAKSRSRCRRGLETSRPKDSLQGTEA